MMRNSLDLLYVSYGQRFGPMQVAINLLRNFSDRRNLYILGVVDKETARAFPDRRCIRIAENVLNLVLTLLVVLLKNRPKICHFNYPPILLTPFLFMMKLQKVKIIYSFHGGVLLEEKRKWKRILFIIQCKHFFDRIIANSRYSAQLLLNVEKCLNKKIVIIPNGVEFEEYTEFTPLKGNPSVLYVGRLEYIKGVDILLKAIALAKKEMPKICLHVVGNGRMLKEIKEQIHNLEIRENVALHGFISRNKLKQLYNGCDLVVIPSRSEPFGIVALEAMVAGKPLIVSNRGALPELIEHNYNGLIVELTPEAFACAILDLTRNEDLRKKMSLANKKVAELYNWKRISEKYIALYTEILKGK